MSRWKRHVLVALAAVAAAAALLGRGGEVARATPVFNVTAIMNGQYLTLGFDFPESGTSPCQTFLRWDVRDRVILEPSGVQPPVPIWAVTWASGTSTYDRCRNPRRLFGQPAALVTHPRAGRVRIRNARSRMLVPWTPLVQVCVHGTRLSPDGVSSGVTCVAMDGVQHGGRIGVPVGENPPHVHRTP